MSLDLIIARGNRGHWGYDAIPNHIECADGFRVSVIAGGGAYGNPRPTFCTCWLPGGGSVVSHPLAHEVAHDYPGPYTEVEVGFPSETPEPWDEWRTYCDDPEKPTETVYSFVPVEMVRALVALHGGEVLKTSEEREEGGQNDS